MYRHASGYRHVSRRALFQVAAAAAASSSPPSAAPSPSTPLPITRPHLPRISALFGRSAWSAAAASSQTAQGTSAFSASQRRSSSWFWWSKGRRWKRALTTLHTLRRTSCGNSVTVYYDTGDAYKAMWDAVDAAKTTIRWQTYICKDDNVGRVTMEKLEAAQRRGVSVELLYDTGGNITGRARLVESLRQSGAIVIAHRSFFSHIWYYFKGGMEWENSPAIRNHRKILIVDETVAFAGGLNIGDDYCSKAMGGNGRFRDTMCKVTGPAVAHLRDVYEDTKTPAERNAARLKRWRKWVAQAVHDARQHRFTAAAAAAATPPTPAPPAAFTASPTAPLKRIRATARLMRSLRAGGRGAEEDGKSWARMRQWWASMRAQQRKLVAQASLARQQRQLQDQERAAAAAGGGLAQTATERLKRRAARVRMRLRPAKRAADAPLASSLPPASSVCEQQTPPGSSTTTMQILACNPERHDWGIQKAFWVVVNASSERVWVTTPYYAPHRKLVKALIAAAKRGVDVRIIAGSVTTTDPFWMWYASQYLSRRLLKAGVKIYEFHGGQILHAKTVAVDSRWASVGSYNWDVMSNKLLEVCVTEDCESASRDATPASLVRQVEEHFERDLAKAKPITIETYRAHSWLLRFQCWAAYHFMMKAERFTFWSYRDPDLTSRLDD